MKKKAKVILLLCIGITILIVVSALTSTSPSQMIHQELERQHEKMTNKAAEVIQKIESNEISAELDTVFFNHPSSVWGITALEGEELIMVNIIVDDARTSYTLHLSATKKHNQDTEFTQYSIHQHK